MDNTEAKNKASAIAKMRFLGDSSLQQWDVEVGLMVYRFIRTHVRFGIVSLIDVFPAEIPEGDPNLLGVH